MGNRASVSVMNCIYVEYKTRIYKIEYPNNVTKEELFFLIKDKTNTFECLKIMLQNSRGNYLEINEAIKQNTIREPYKLEVLSAEVYGMDLKPSDIQMCLKELKELKQMVVDMTNKFESKSELEIKGIENVPIYPKFHLSPEIIQLLKTPTFNMWRWGPSEMLSIMEFMFEELGLIEEFQTDSLTLKRWLLCIQANYRNNPFHNFRHCFCVAQMMYGLIYLCELSKIMNRTQIGSLFIAAICHDLDHPGFNNLYQINARTPIAIRYNDISPLENHHCAVAFQILSDPLCNILANVPNHKFKEIRSRIIKLILATDMVKHKSIIEDFQKNLENFSPLNEEHSNNLSMILIKCCDISNEARPFEIAEPWLDCLLEEYFMQSDREKKEGLPVAIYMDREKVTKPNSQVGFIKFVLLPIFESLVKLFPQTEKVIIQPLQDSLTRYEKMMPNLEQ